MPQYPWLEFNEGRWRLISDVRVMPTPENRKWSDKDAVLAELYEEGWVITGPYPNEFSDKLGLENKFHGYELMRTIH
jgi:hypothetical protein